MKKLDNQLLSFILQSAVYAVISLLIAFVISIFLHKPILSLIPALIGCFLGRLGGKVLYNRLSKKN